MAIGASADMPLLNLIFRLRSRLRLPLHMRDGTAPPVMPFPLDRFLGVQRK
jgi:hypothetical protein